MIKRLKRNLYILLIGSLMLVFSIVLGLLIHQNIKEKRKVSIANLNRMASMLIFSFVLFTGNKKTASHTSDAEAYGMGSRVPFYPYVSTK